MATINLDAQIKTRQLFHLAGKDREVVFTDKLTKDLLDMEFSISELAEKIEKEAEQKKKSNQLTVKETKKNVEDLLAAMKKECIHFLDCTFGEGSGSEVYHFFENSTMVLPEIIHAISEEAQKTRVLYKKDRYKKKR